jgi:asparaginyl-tRNA synthetase
MKRTKIADITTQLLGSSITLCGWVKTLRDQKEFSFIELTDGSTLSGIQIIAGNNLADYEKIIKNLSTGASLQITGTLVESPGHKQKWELQAQTLKVLGSCPGDDYPLQKKRHSFEFLRTIAHLRPRTNTQGAVLRVRNALAFATHLFFQQRKFLYIQTPIITASDCEGAGEQFLVTTLDLQNIPKKQDKSVDFSKDFFQKPAYLTVSGQLNAETLACALSDV